MSTTKQDELLAAPAVQRSNLRPEQFGAIERAAAAARSLGNKATTQEDPYGGLMFHDDADVLDNMLASSGMPASLLDAMSDGAIDEFLETYELLGETDDGQETATIPNDAERVMFKDAIAGFLATLPLNQGEAQR